MIPNALRVNAAHYMLYRSVLARGVHRLKDDEQRMNILCIKHVLQPVIRSMFFARSSLA